jgi:hypothetical protein
MLTPEGKVKKKVTATLKKYKAYYHMPVQSGYGAVALDYHVCHHGQYAGIETKAPGKKPTKLQQQVIEEIEAAGGDVFIIKDDTGVALLESWLRGISNAAGDRDYD